MQIAAAVTGFGSNRILVDSLFVGDCESCEPMHFSGDVDGDGDVDFTDFSVLAGNFTGAIRPPAPPATGG